MEQEHLLEISVKLANFVKILIEENRELRKDLKLLEKAQADPTVSKHQLSALDEKMESIFESNRLIAEILIEMRQQS